MRPLMTPLSETILYLVHPRGFTRHASSGVEHKGTFAGIVEKIPYLKELGITAVELMPSYEFLELEKPECREMSMEDAVNPLQGFTRRGRGSAPDQLLGV